MKLLIALLTIFISWSTTAQWCSSPYEFWEHNAGFASYHFDDSAMLDFDTTDQQFQFGYYFLPPKIDTVQSGIWNICVPQKGIGFDSAYSQNKVIITDSLNAYPANDSSFFEIVTNEFSECIRFRIKFDTDTLHDGFFLTASNDHGETWYNYLSSSPFQGDHYILCAPTIDTLINGQLGVSGTSTTWETIEIRSFYYGVKSVNDTILYRFNFVSDTVDNSRKGVMIDNIETFSSFLPGEVRENQSKLSIYPNPTLNQITISDKLNRKISGVMIYNQVGKVVRDEFNPNKDELDVSDLPSGYYFIEVNFDGKKERQVFVKE